MEDLTKAQIVALAEFRQALRKFMRVAEQNARGAGITPQQYQAMLAVQGRQDREWATVSEIAEALQLRHHAASELLNRCETADLVKRSREHSDRRTVQVRLTENGAAALKKVARLNVREITNLRGLVEALDHSKRASA